MGKISFDLFLSVHACHYVYGSSSFRDIQMERILVLLFIVNWDISVGLPFLNNTWIFEVVLNAKNSMCYALCFSWFV